MKLSISSLKSVYTNQYSWLCLTLNLSNSEFGPGKYCKQCILPACVWPVAMLIYCCDKAG